MKGPLTEPWGKLSGVPGDIDLAWHPLRDHCVDVAAWSFRLSSGFFSSATNWEMMLLTSRPLVPTPGDEMVAISTS